MRQFAVFANSGSGARHAPYVINVQSDLFETMTLLVAPLVQPNYIGRPIARLNPCLVVDGMRLFLSPLEMSAVTRRDLGPVVADLGDSRDDIIAALDMLYTGF